MKDLPETIFLVEQQEERGTREPDRELEHLAHRENRGSQRVMEKLGLRPEGETAWRGQPVTWYAIARSEWQASAS